LAIKGTVGGIGTKGVVPIVGEGHDWKGARTAIKTDKNGTQSTVVLPQTFTSPDSPFRLYLTDQGIVRSMHSNSRPLPEWREIQRISPEVLHQIGQDFTADLDEIQKSVLVPTLREAKWWFPFFDRLQSLGLKYKWVEFRRKRIQDEFKRKIEEIGTLPLPQPQAQELALALLPQPVEAARQTQSDLSIRKIAADVVQRMTESELRGLNLPLGYVVDSLTTR
jgi:hypothetical protein